MVGNIEQIKQAVMSLCYEFISERIEGLEVVSRKIRNNPVLIIRVPSSARTPHMVTINHNTAFCTRYQEGKREMTIGEIREAFNNDYIGRKLSEIENYLRRNNECQSKEEMKKQILEKVETDRFENYLSISDKDLLNQATLLRFEKETKDLSYLWLSINPTTINANIFDVESKEFRELIHKPPGSRDGGWNMESSYFKFERIEEGIRRGEKRFEYLEVWENGHMEFWTPLDDHFCWRQTAEEFQKRPRLYPYPVTEYPTTFLRLYRALLDLFSVTNDFVLTLYLRNLKGYILLPYAPNSIGFMHPSSIIEPYKKDNLIRSIHLDHGFKPDLASFNILKPIYAAFGYDSEAIPFFDKNTQEFNFK